MATFTLTEAAKAVGLSRSSVFRAIKAGRVSAARTEDNVIEASELFRVFTPVETTPSIAPAQDVTVTMAQLDAQIAMLRERIAELTENRNSWKEQSMRLALPRPVETTPTRRRWWQRAR